MQASSLEMRMRIKAFDVGLMCTGRHIRTWFFQIIQEIENREQRSENFSKSELFRLSI